MINKIKDIFAFGKIKARKISNTIKFSPISAHIQPAFGNKQNLVLYNKSRSTGPEPCVCHAPLRSIYFDIYGNATACCFNRAHVLGIYPQQSLSEIIYGNKRRFLQKELCRQNFMYGCQHCHKLIESKNFEGTEARMYDNLKDQGVIPSEIIFELDNTCNLACKMCHEGFSSTIARQKGLEKIKHSYDDEFLKQLSELIPTLRVAKFLGGEPFLIEIYYRIWDMILEINPKCKILLQTNGTIFNDKIKSYLKRGNFYIGVSVDSLKKEVFESIRCNAVFETVMENIKRFSEIAKRKHTYVNVSVCPMLQNRNEIPELVDFCNQNGLFVYFNTVYTEGFALSSADEGELLDLLKIYRQHKFKNRGIIAKRNIEFFKNLISNVESWYNVKEQASRYTRRRHKWNNKMLLEVLTRLASEDKNAKIIINKVFQEIEIEFLLSDQDIENLNKMEPEELIFATHNETEEQLKSRILRFVELGKFGN